MKASRRAVIVGMGLLALGAIPARASAQGMIFQQNSLTLINASGRHVFKVDVATNVSEADFGLRYRGYLDPDTGFLILLSSAAPEPIAVTTDGVSIPLDLLFIASDGTVMEVHASLAPNSKTPIVSNSPVAAALELNAGSIAAYGINAGDKVVGAGLGSG